MIQIVVVSHGGLAAGLLDSARMIIGEREGVHAISFTQDTGFEQFEDHLATVLPPILELGPTLVFTDILGGSPFKAAARYSFNNNDVAVVYGVNLPVLVDAILARGDDLASLTERVVKQAPMTIGLSEI